jgi:hypothetical protein
LHNSTSFYDKSFEETSIQGTYLNIIKVIYFKPIAKIILNEEKLKTFPLKSGMRQKYPHSPLLFNIVLEFLVSTIRLMEEIKGIQIGRKEVKLFLFSDDMILYLKEPKNSTKNSSTS